MPPSTERKGKTFSQRMNFNDLPGNKTQTDDRVSFEVNSESPAAAAAFTAPNKPKQHLAVTSPLAHSDERHPGHLVSSMEQKVEDPCSLQQALNLHTHLV